MNPNETYTILLVDDEEGIRKVLGITLMDMGFGLLTAENADVALNIFRQQSPPIVMTDIKMPGMDGIELLRIIKQENPDTEVIMITGHGELNLAIRSLKFEAIDFIAKPINDEAVEIALKRAIERISMRRQLRAYTQELERLVEEKSRQLIDAERMAAVGQTVAGLSHAIKNIATGLKGGAFVLEQGLKSGENECLERGWLMVKENVERIARLSMDMLNYAKTAQIQRQLCDPNQPAREVIELLAGQARRHGVVLKAELTPELEPFSLDPEGIYQCLLNLTGNAIEACAAVNQAGDAPKTVVLRTLCPARHLLEYQVEDNGCGMTPETLEKVFRRFFTTKGLDGNGLGLMMTKNIIDQHQGKISARSALGQGALFRVQLG